MAEDTTVTDTADAFFRANVRCLLDYPKCECQFNCLALGCPGIRLRGLGLEIAYNGEILTVPSSDDAEEVLRAKFMAAWEDHCGEGLP